MKRSLLIAGTLAAAGALVLSLFLIAGGIRLLKGWVASVTAALGPEAAGITAIVALCVILSAWLIASALRAASRDEVRSAQFHQRTAIYESILEGLSGRGAGRPLRESALLLLGSREVVHAYRQLCASLAQEHASPDDVAAQYRQILLAMRRDLGAECFGVDVGPLVVENATRSPSTPPSPEAEMFVRNRR